MATKIVFTGGETKATVRVDLDVDEVGKRLRIAKTFERFEVKGKAVWVNPANVLFIEEQGDARLRSL